MHPHPEDPGPLGLTSRERLERAVEGPLGLPPGIDPSFASLVVMGELVERLTPGEAHLLMDDLPASLHALLCPCEAHRGHHPTLRMHRAEMLARIAARLGTTPARAEAIAISVFAAIRREVRLETAQHVAAQLPRDIKELWLATRPVIPSPDSALAMGARERVEREITRRTPLPRGITASAAFTEVMSVFFARLSGGEAIDVLLGFPDELRNLIEGAAIDRDEHARVFGRDELVATVANRLGIQRAEAARLVPAVLASAKRILPVREIDDVTAQLPADLRELWLAAS